MLNKAIILDELSQAKVAHMRWIKRVDHLISGMPVEEYFIPLEPTACGFGKWLYGLVGEKLRSIYIFESTICQIEMTHDKLHAVYGEIYNIFYSRPQSRTLLHMIVTLGSNKVSKKELLQAKEYFSILQEYSLELIHQIEKLEKAVKAVDMVVLQRREQSSVPLRQV